MKVCILTVGVVRPSVERVIKNLETTRDSFLKTGHEITHYAFPYKDSFEGEIKKQNPPHVKLNFIDPITEEVGDHPQWINSYRMVKSIQTAHESIKNLERFDAIVRHRLDFEVNSIQLPNEVSENTYYSARYDSTGIYDNFGLCSPSLFKQIWNAETPNRFKGKNNEAMLLAQVRRLNARLKVINFEVTGYQSGDKTWNGIPQWSKRNRNWISKEGDSDITRRRHD